ncbi:MAG: hypothetical protein F8N36_15940 [Desulfovibrio sp.]|uniref:hypothetical protein n=1 Tax=Desulfovibrio sp. TaxID=885 RepID=UPI00135E7C7B|nr:hypothetical protein [Desulfovibrio sp.]MTJ94330.1 hypothetical protein [Desulfovibrio sp.]
MQFPKSFKDLSTNAKLGLFVAAVVVLGGTYQYLGLNNQAPLDQPAKQTSGSRVAAPDRKDGAQNGSVMAALARLDETTRRIAENQEKLMAASGIAAVEIPQRNAKQRVSRDTVPNGTIETVDPPPRNGTIDRSLSDSDDDPERAAKIADLEGRLKDAQQAMKSMTDALKELKAKP